MRKAARIRPGGAFVTVGECIAQLLLIGFPVAILALINGERR
jgi:hypothetical protein